MPALQPEPYISWVCSHWKGHRDMIGFVYDDSEATENFNPQVEPYYWEAVQAFLTGSYLASTMLSSACVEIAINNHPKMLNGRLRKTPEPWLRLNPTTLKLAQEHGLPVDSLCSEGEEFGEGRLKFIKTRHLFAHGEIHPGIGPIYGSSYKDDAEARFRSGKSPVQVIAVEQLRLAHDFLVELYSSQALR